MSTPETIIRQWFKEVWEGGDERAMFGSDARRGGPRAERRRGAQLRGPRSSSRYFHAMRGALSDLRVDIKRVVTEGDICVAHCHVRARHTGESLGGPATERPVTSGAGQVRVRDGQLIQGWNCFEFLSMYQQLGWVHDL